jgi:quinolinate synthase
MATASQVDQCWSDLTSLGLADVTIPVTYMNSSAAIKSFTGKNGGTICTSSNAEKSMKWALEKGQKILFLPDQHLGRNTAVASLGLTTADCAVWNPWKPMGGLTEEEIRAATVILWRGHCSVHGRFTKSSIDEYRSKVPDIKIIVHPECQHEVVQAADVVGSTEKIISVVSSSPAGSKWAVGTELNLVGRLAAANPDKEVFFLDRTVCYCSTMNRIDLPHLVWAMESIVAGHIVNVIKVDEETTRYAKLALEQMLAL